MDERFAGRLCWNGSKKTDDLQDGSIFLLNVTKEDEGTYVCIFHRTLKFPLSKHEEHTQPNKTFNITVVTKRKRLHPVSMKTNRFQTIHL